MKSSAIVTIKQIKKQFEKKLAISFFWVYNWYVEKKGKNMIEKISHFIFGLAIVMSVLAGATSLFAYQGHKMQQYAIEHNCRWDYNDMCYTVEQRPWLFND